MVKSIFYNMKYTYYKNLGVSISSVKNYAIFPVNFSFYSLKEKDAA